MQNLFNKIDKKTAQKTWQQAYIKNGLYCLAILLCLVISVLLMSGCGQKTGQAINTEALPENELKEPDKPKPDESFTILATGDIMMHDLQIQAGWLKEEKRYDYAYMFEHIAPILQQGDLVIGNLEVPLAGAETGYSGYPMFNAPEILATNLKDAGFDVVSTANNHCLDRRYNGLTSTLDFLDEARLLHTGTARSAQEQEQILMIPVKGVQIALIAATYGTNGMPIPKGKEYAVNLLDQDMLLGQIEKARQEGAQYVIMMLHWGQEYAPEPNQEQISLAEALFAGGADLIIGHHPHVLQKGEVLAADEPFGASGKDKNNFVMYSLGNFISSQKGLERLSSLVLKVEVGIDQETGEPYFIGAEYIPIYTQKKNSQGKNYFAVWPIEKALAEIQQTNSTFTKEEAQALPKAWDHILASQPAMFPMQIQRDPI